MKVYINEISHADLLLYKDFASDILEGRKRVTFVDAEGNSAVLFVEQKLIDKLGVPYLEDNSSMRYSDVFEEWVVTVSEKAYYNDPKRFPPKVIPVKYVEDKMGENTQVWQNVDTGQYYLRTLCREPFARWMTCDKRMYGYQDRACVRANITFVNDENQQTESITYDDWNGNAAYSDTFNPEFTGRK